MSHQGRPPGLLIAVEGIDGAGTTTQCKRLVEWLEARGRPAHLTCEPSAGPIGQLLRRVLRAEPDPAGVITDRAAIALLFAADRLDHLAREIRPALATGVVVITDRYVMSSLAYQTLDVPRAFIAAANAQAPAADLTILVDVPVEIAAERRWGRGAADELFDALETQRCVAESYRRELEAARAAGRQVALVDGRGSADQVFAALSAELAKICFAGASTPS